MNYDIIGDIHGNSQSLMALLEKLGYKNQKGIYLHPSRKVIFLGDFIDRGVFQREVISIVRQMMDANAALSVMGNHEFNAIAFSTPDPDSADYLRPHSEKNINQHKAFLDAYQSSPEDYEDVISWFKTLPLWLDLGELRVIHACWDTNAITKIIEHHDDCHLSEDLLRMASKKGTWQYEAIETILKGKEVPLKSGATFKDKEGNVRHDIRVRWWDQHATTYRKAYMGPESARTHIPDDPIEGDYLVEYSHEEPPVFLGHYWMEGDITPIAPNIACLDYSVAKSGGRLVAYSWDGEQSLESSKYVWVERIES